MGSTARYWNWAGASGFSARWAPGGLNLGAALAIFGRGENAVILEGPRHKLGAVKFDYTSGDYMKPWRFTDGEGRLD